MNAKITEGFITKHIIAWIREPFNKINVHKLISFIFIKEAVSFKFIEYFGVLHFQNYNFQFLLKKNEFNTREKCRNCGEYQDYGIVSLYCDKIECEKACDNYAAEINETN